MKIHLALPPIVAFLVTAFTPHVSSAQDCSECAGHVSDSCCAAMRGALRKRGGLLEEKEIPGSVVHEGIERPGIYRGCNFTEVCNCPCIAPIKTPVLKSTGRTLESEAYVTVDPAWVEAARDVGLEIEKVEISIGIGKSSIGVEGRPTKVRKSVTVYSPEMEQVGLARSRGPCGCIRALMAGLQHAVEWDRDILDTLNDAVPAQADKRKALKDSMKEKLTAIAAIGYQFDNDKGLAAARNVGGVCRPPGMTDKDVGQAMLDADALIKDNLKVFERNLKRNKEWGYPVPHRLKGLDGLFSPKDPKKGSPTGHAPNMILPIPKDGLHDLAAKIESRFGLDVVAVPISNSTTMVTVRSPAVAFGTSTAELAVVAPEEVMRSVDPPIGERTLAVGESAIAVDPGRAPEVLVALSRQGTTPENPRENRWLRVRFVESRPSTQAPIGGVFEIRPPSGTIDGPFDFMPHSGPGGALRTVPLAVDVEPRATASAIEIRKADQTVATFRDDVIVEGIPHPVRVGRFVMPDEGAFKEFTESKPEDLVLRVGAAGEEIPLTSVIPQGFRTGLIRPEIRIDAPGPVKPGQEVPATVLGNVEEVEARQGVLLGTLEKVVWQVDAGGEKTEIGRGRDANLKVTATAPSSGKLVLQTTYRTNAQRLSSAVTTADAEMKSAAERFPSTERWLPSADTHRPDR